MTSVYWNHHARKTALFALILSASVSLVTITAHAQGNNRHRGKSSSWSEISPVRATSSYMRRETGSSLLNNNSRYRAVPIGVLPGKTNSLIAEESGVINNLGHIVGFSFSFTGDPNDAFLTAQPFLWKNGKLTALPLLKGWPAAFATGINDLDQAIGEANKFTGDGTRVRRALFWNKGHVTDLGALDTNSSSQAFSINLWGVVVGVSRNLDSGVTLPVAWYGGKIHSLPLLPGEDAGFALGIGESGIIAGWQVKGDDESETPCLWLRNGTGYVPVALPNVGGDFGEANSANIFGQAVGFSLRAGDLHGPGVVWDFGRPHALPMLPGDTDGYANAINDLGQIVGFSEQFDDQGDELSQRVVLWQNGTVTDLQTVVPEDTPQLTDMGNINLFGQIAVDAGFSDDGSIAAYVLVPK